MIRGSERSQSPGGLFCHTFHRCLFPSSLSPVSKASLTDPGAVPRLCWLGMNLHTDLLNNSFLPLSLLLPSNTSTAPTDFRLPTADWELPTATSSSVNVEAWLRIQSFLLSFLHYQVSDCPFPGAPGSLVYFCVTCIPQELKEGQMATALWA